MKIEKIEDLKVGDWVLMEELHPNRKFIVLDVDYDKGTIKFTSPDYLAWDSLCITFKHYNFVLIGKTRPKLRLLYRLFSGKGGIICPFKMIPVEGYKKQSIEQKFLDKLS